METVLTPAARISPRLSLSICLGWGLGTVSVVSVLTAANTILLAYLTDVIGIAPAVASILIAVSKIYDAVADPTMGVISDRTNTRIGRRRPYLLAGGVLLAISMIALFTDPHIADMTWRVAYFGGVLFFWATAYTIFNVPYVSMPAEMTQDYQERAYLMTFRVYGVAGAQVVAATIGVALVKYYGGGSDGHAKMALTLAPVILATAFACFWMTRAAPFAYKSHPSGMTFWRQAKLVAQNKPFCLLIGMKFLTLMGLGTQSAQAYFFTKILKRGYDSLSVYFFLYSAGMVVAQPMWLWISRKIGKRNALLLALGASLPLALSWFLSDAGEPVMFVYLRGLIAGLYSGGMIMLGQAMLPDTMEYDFRRTGLRREGLFAGLYTTVEKLSGAIGITIIGTLLSVLGYVASAGGNVVQPKSADVAIYIGVAVVPLLINGGAFLLMLGYDLTEEKLKTTVSVL